jgi:hypothetical protein
LVHRANGLCLSWAVYARWGPRSVAGDLV